MKEPTCKIEIKNKDDLVVMCITNLEKDVSMTLKFTPNKAEDVAAALIETANKIK